MPWEVAREQRGWFVRLAPMLPHASIPHEHTIIKVASPAGASGAAIMLALGPHRVFVYVGITSLSLSRIDRLCAANLRSKLLQFVKT
jgi:hypothetical protein